MKTRLRLPRSRKAGQELIPERLPPRKRARVIYPETGEELLAWEHAQLAESEKKQASALDGLTPQPLQEALRPLDSFAVAERLTALGVDPVSIVARIAAGDVIGLGCMTYDEYCAPATYDLDGTPIVPDGKTKALILLPPKLRLDAAKELLRLIAKPPSQEDLSPSEVGGRVLVYLPDNGRAPKQPVPASQADDLRSDPPQVGGDV